MYQSLLEFQSFLESVKQCVCGSYVLICCTVTVVLQFFCFLELLILILEGMVPFSGVVFQVGWGDRLCHVIWSNMYFNTKQDEMGLPTEFH